MLIPFGAVKAAPVISFSVHEEPCSVCYWTWIAEGRITPWPCLDKFVHLIHQQKLSFLVLMVQFPVYIQY
ncbi:unnamed protein product [Victoria cruziana]